MSLDTPPFAEGSFFDTTLKYCAELGYPIAHRSETSVILELKAPMEETKQIIHISEASEQEIEFSLGTIFKFDEGAEIPYSLLLALLQANDVSASTNIGHWRVEYFKGKRWVSLMRLEPKSHLNVERFSEVIFYLMIQCEDFETTFELDEDEESEE